MDSVVLNWGFCILGRAAGSYVKFKWTLISLQTPQALSPPLISSTRTPPLPSPPLPIFVSAKIPPQACGHKLFSSVRMPTLTLGGDPEWAVNQRLIWGCACECPQSREFCKNRQHQQARTQLEVGSSRLVQLSASDTGNWWPPVISCHAAPVVGRSSFKETMLYSAVLGESVHRTPPQLEPGDSEVDEARAAHGVVLLFCSCSGKLPMVGKSVGCVLS